jgi:PGF-pre-PGF domain-containing protein
MRACRGSSLFLAAVVVLALCMCAGMVSAATVTLESGTIPGPGQETVLNLTMDEAPDGLAGYNINLTIDSDIVTVKKVDFPSWAKLHDAEGLDEGNKVRLMGVDLGSALVAGSKNIELATITIEGKTPGSSTIHLSHDRFDDHSGGSITRTLVDSTVTVNTPPPSHVTLEDTTFGAPGEERVINLTLDKTQYGLAGYAINITIDDPRMAQFTDVSFPKWALMNKVTGLSSGKEIRVMALDPKMGVPNVSTNIHLASIKLHGLMNGSTSVRITQSRIEDHTEKVLPVILDNSTIHIGAWENTPSAPVIAFSASPRSGNAPLSVAFTDTSSNSPSMWSWSFGDGTYSTEKNPSHTYTAAGTYAVSLIATNPDGSSIATEEGYVTVAPPLPVKPLAGFSATPLSGAPPLTGIFTDESTNSPTGWAWFFGDEDYSQAWTTQTSNAGWPGRFSHCTVSLPDGSIVLMGGSVKESNKQIEKNDTWRSTDNGITWVQQNASSGWLARVNPSCVAMPDNSIVIMGGFVGNYTFMKDVWRSTDNGTTWMLQTDNAAWPARYTHTSVVMPDGSIILMGGWDGSNYLNEVWRSTDSGATWTLQTGGASWSRRSEHTSVAMPDGSIVLIGGRGSQNDPDGSTKDNAWRSIDNGVTWTEMNASIWGPDVQYQWYNSVAMPDGSIVVLGGSTYNAIGTGGKTSNAVWRSKDNGATWTQPANAGWTGRWGHTSVAMPDGSIIVLGGADPFIGRNDVWRLTPAGSYEQNPTHTYTAPGNYSVTLQSYNAAGFNSSRKTNYITVTPPPFKVPGIISSASQSVVAQGDRVFINGTTDGSPSSVQAWVFGKNYANRTTVPVATDGSYTYEISQTATRNLYPDQYWVVVQHPQQNGKFDIDLCDAANGGSNYVCSFGDPAKIQQLFQVKGAGSLSATNAAESLVLAINDTAIDDTSSRTQFTVEVPVIRITPVGDRHVGDKFNITAETNLAVGDDVLVQVYMSKFKPTEKSQEDGTFIGSSGAVKVTRGDSGMNALLFSVDTSLYLPDEYIVVEAAVDQVATGTAIFNVLASTSPSSTKPPVADFTANRTEGDKPLAVKFTDTSTNTPVSWTWNFGDGTTSFVQNPVHTYSSAGTYTVNLTATNAAGSNKTVKNACITVIELVVKGNGFILPSITTPTPGTIAINATNATHTGNFINVTSGTGAWDHVGFTLTDPPALDGTGKNWTGTVGSVTAVTEPLTAPIASAGTPTVQIALNMSGMPGDTSSLLQTLTKYPDAAAQSSFSLAASGDGKQIDDIAYSLNVDKINLANHGDGGIIQSATLTMTVSPAWVAAHGGLSRIVILRRGEDGTTQILTPVLTGTDAAGNYILTVFSPNGLSTFSLASVSAISTGSGGSSSGYSSTSSGDSGSGGTPAGSLTSTSTAKLSRPDPGTGPWTTLHVNGPTHITQVDIQTTQAMKDIFVVTERPGSVPQGVPSPGMPVYEYHKVNLYHATDSDVNQAVIGFTVSESWLKEQKMSEGDIQLIRFHNNAWERLDTEYTGKKDGNFVYKATSGGFSYFATVLVKGATIVPAQGSITTAPAVTASPLVTVPAALHAVTPRAPETQAVPPVPVTPPQKAASPVPLIVFGIAAIVVLSVSIVAVRRWWIRRQNPALFRDLE